MNKKDKIFTIISVLILILLSYIYFSKRINDNTESNIEEEKMEEEYIINELTAQEQEYVVDYISKNISRISPEKEVLGGKFYVTGYDFENGENVIVEYEDGHIMFRARIEFGYVDSENITIKKVEILR